MKQAAIISVVIWLCAEVRAETYVVDPAGAISTISQAAQKVRAGDVVLVKPGVYRESVRLTQSGTPESPIVFRAETPGSVVITGADPITSWKRIDGEEPIVATSWQHVFAIDQQNGKPIEFHPDSAPLWGRAEQVIADDQQLLPCKDLADLRAAWKDRAKRCKPPLKNLGGPFAGMFAADTTLHVLYLWLADGSDPSAHAMQASTRSQLFGVSEFESKEGVHDVEVSGFVFRYAANFAQRSAVVLHGKDNNLHHCLIEKMAGRGVSVSGTMRNCLIKGNGHTGGAVEGDDFLVEQCVWEGNCWKPIDRGWESGGVKLCDSRNGMFKECIFLRNGGPGLWFDIDDRDIKVLGSAFIENELSGVFIEISRNIQVIGNDVRDNAAGVVGEVKGDSWSAGGIQLGESQDCEISANRCIGNRDGITLREIGPRPVSTRGDKETVYHTAGHKITENMILSSRAYALALWWDNDFFGPHPNQVDKFKSTPAWKAHLRETADRVYDPAAQKLTIDGNVYDAKASFLFGAEWRKEAAKFRNVADFSKRSGFEVGALKTDKTAVIPPIEEQIKRFAPFDGITR